jgi:hypothetical protein
VRLNLAITAIGLALGGCVALGAWVYEDPVIALRSATVRRDSLDLVFVVCNRNDYDLSLRGFGATVAVAGDVVAVGGREEPIILRTRDSSRFVLTLPLSEIGFAPHETRRSFELTTHEKLLSTPIGDRQVANQFTGRVTRQGEGLKWSTEATLCRPGLSTLPPQFDARPVSRPPTNPPADRPMEH